MKHLLGSESFYRKLFAGAFLARDWKDDEVPDLLVMASWASDLAEFWEQLLSVNNLGGNYSSPPTAYDFARAPTGAWLGAFEPFDFRPARFAIRGIDSFDWPSVRRTVQVDPAPPGYPTGYSVGFNITLDEITLFLPPNTPSGLYRVSLTAQSAITASTTFNHLR